PELGEEIDHQNWSFMVSGCGPGGRAIQYVSAAGSRLSRNRSLPRNRITMPVGQIVPKNKRPITIGLTILCSSNPSFIQTMFSGRNAEGLRQAAARKAMAAAVIHG